MRFAGRKLGSLTAALLMGLTLAACSGGAGARPVSLPEPSASVLTASGTPSPSAQAPAASSPTVSPPSQPSSAEAKAKPETALPSSPGTDPLPSGTIPADQTAQDEAGDFPAASPDGASPNDKTSPDDQEKPPVHTEASLVAVGDIMAHSPQLPGYYDAKTGKYDFSPWFKQVAPILKQGDWVFGNLETPIAGSDLKYSGYPRFNAPTELAGTLKDAGFQILSTANNHTLDRGFIGLTRTLRNLRTAGLVPVGTNQSKTDAQRLVIEERNGIKLGFLAYTFSTNQIPMPKDHPYAVNMIDMPAISNDIARMRRAGADAVVVSLHFGIEYERMPSSSQRSIARKVIAAGADIVLGSHPHVVQPYETIEVPDPERPGGVRRGFVIYSLGNFISNQKDDWKDVGVILQLKLTKTLEPDGTSLTEWSDVRTTPTYVLTRMIGENKHYTVLPLPQSLANRGSKTWNEAEYAKMSELLDGIDKHLRSMSGQ